MDRIYTNKSCFARIREKPHWPFFTHLFLSSLAVLKAQGPGFRWSLFESQHRMIAKSFQLWGLEVLGISWVNGRLWPPVLALVSLRKRRGLGH